MLKFIMCCATLLNIYCPGYRIFGNPITGCKISGNTISPVSGCSDDCMGEVARLNSSRVLCSFFSFGTKKSWPIVSGFDSLNPGLCKQSQATKTDVRHGT